MASIPLPALDVKPPEQQNPIDSLGRIVALKSALQNQQYRQQEQPLELQTRQNEVQQQNLSLASTKAMQKAYTEANGDPDQTIHLAAKYGALPGDLQKFQMANVDYKSKLASMTKDQQAVIGTAADNLAGVLKPIADIKDPQQQAFEWSKAKQALTQEYQQDPQKAALRYGIPDPSQLPDYPGSADGVKLVMAHLQGVKAQAEQAAAAQTAGARSLAAQTEAAKFSATQDPTSPLYAPSSAAVALGVAPGTKAAQQGEVQLAGRKAGAEAAARQPYEMSLAAQKQALSQGNPNAAAQLLVNGDATLSELKSRGATPDFIANTLAAAHRLSNGQYNAQAADAQFQVAKSPANVAFFGSAKSLTDPGGTLDQLAKVGNMIPGNQIPAFNSIADWEKAATGNGPLAKYAATALGVADDYSKVMGGGQGSDTSRLQALNLIKASASPEARAGALQGIRGAVGSQVASRVGSNPVLNRMYGDVAKNAPAASGGGNMIYARDPQGNLHSAPAGTKLPDGWKQENK